jgi:hypothetical protein
MDPDEKEQKKESESTAVSYWPEDSGTPGESADHKRADLQESLEDEEDESQYFERLFALKKKEDEEKKERVRIALGKFNVFLHLTAYIAAVAYLLLLGILVRSALVWVLIVIGLWTVAISYHFYWAFALKSPPRKKKKKKKPPSQPRGFLPPEADEVSGEDPDKDAGEDRG